MGAHLSALVAVAGVPFGHVLGPLVVYLIKAHESAFIASHAKASLNYQITISIVGTIGVILAVAAWFWLIFSVALRSRGEQLPAAMPLGVVAFWVSVAVAALLIVLVSVVFIIQGTIAASEGRTYTYPFAIRFLS